MTYLICWRYRPRVDAIDARRAITQRRFRHAPGISDHRGIASQCRWFGASFFQLDLSQEDKAMYTQGHLRIVGIGIHTPEKCVPSREIMEYLDSENRFGHSHRLAREGYGGKRKACLT